MGNSLSSKAALTALAKFQMHNVKESQVTEVFLNCFHGKFWTLVMTDFVFYVMPILVNFAHFSSDFCL